MLKLIARIKNLKIRNKLLLSLILTGCIPLMAIGLTTYYMSVNILKDNVADSIKDSSLKLSYIISEECNGYYDFLSSLLSDDDFVRFSIAEKTGNYVDFEEEYNRGLKRNLSNYGITDEQFRVYSKNITYPHDYLYSINDFSDKFGNINTNGFEWIFLDKKIHLVAPITNLYTLDLVGYVEIVFEPNEMFKSCSVVNYSQYGIFITDKNEQVLFQKIDMNKLYETVPATTFMDGQINVTYHGKKYIVGASEIGQAGWTVTCFVLNSEITSGMKTVNNILLISIAASFVFVIIVSLVMSNHILHRIRLLKNEMKKVEQGGLMVVSLNKEPFDEIGELTFIFENMLSSINLHIENEYKFNLQIREAELKALQAQINPHFLYNCMSIINWRAAMSGDEKIQHIVENLSNFYRTSLNRGKSEISILDETLNARAYLELQLELHDNNFTVIYDIDDNIGKYETINLTLQPIIENAIEHGVNECLVKVDLLNKPQIILSIKDMGATIMFRVMNTGKPIEKDLAEKIITQKTKGYGLNNVNDRLKKRYGNQYGLAIYPVENEGTECIYTIPKILYNGESYAEKENY